MAKSKNAKIKTAYEEIEQKYLKYGSMMFKIKWMGKVTNEQFLKITEERSLCENYNESRAGRWGADGDTQVLSLVMECVVKEKSYR